MECITDEQLQEQIDDFQQTMTRLQQAQSIRENQFNQLHQSLQLLQDPLQRQHALHYLHIIEHQHQRLQTIIQQAIDRVDQFNHHQHQYIVTELQQVQIQMQQLVQMQEVTQRQMHFRLLVHGDEIEE